VRGETLELVGELHRVVAEPRRVAPLRVEELAP
jgi:hypothetical protein